MAPRLWLQGAELTITGGSGSSKQAAIWAALAQIAPWVQITALGWPVEPEVNRYLAWSEGCALAACGTARSSSAKAMSPGRRLRDAITRNPERLGAERPCANRAASSV